MDQGASRAVGQTGRGVSKKQEAHKKDPTPANQGPCGQKPSRLSSGAAVGPLASQVKEREIQGFPYGGRNSEV